MANMNWRFILCVLWLPVAEALNWTLKDDSLDLADGTLFIAREHISKFSSTVVVAEHSLRTGKTNSNSLLFDYLLLHLQGTIAVQLYIGTFHNQLWDYYIFIVDSFEALRAIRWTFPINYFERYFYFLIVLTKYTPNYNNIMQQIFKTCYNFQVINVNIILDHPKLGVCMFTYKLFTEDDCWSFQPVLYFRFNDGPGNLKTIFPQKLNNFYGCSIKVTVRAFPPMLIFTGNTSDPKPIGLWENLSGFEGMLLKLISEQLNFSIELLPFANGRDECFSGLLSGAADVAVGAFSGSDPGGWAFSKTKQYHYSPFVYIVRGSRLMSSLSRLARPFNYQVWILLALLLIFGQIIIQVMRYVNPSIGRRIISEENATPMVNFVAVFLGYSIVRLPREYFPRCAILLLLFFTLIIRSAYQGALYDAIRWDKFVKTPSGFDDLMKWNYKMFLTKDAGRFFPINRTIVLTNGTYINRFKMLEGTHAKYVTVTLRENNIHYIARPDNWGSDLIMINEPVYMYHTVMYFPKNSIYLRAFNKKLEVLEISGLTNYARTLFNIEPGSYRKHKHRLSKIALTNNHLKGMYDIYATMMILTLVTFATELISLYSLRLRRIIEWIN